MLPFEVTTVYTNFELFDREATAWHFGLCQERESFYEARSIGCRKADNNLIPEFSGTFLRKLSGLIMISTA